MTIQKCSPVQMRKSMEMAEALKNAGIGFVPMPVIDDEQWQQRMLESAAILEKLCLLAEDEGAA